LSYDFELYTGRKHSLELPPRSVVDNIRVDGPDHTEDEDLPSHYLPVLGKKRVLYRIHVAGDWASLDQTSVDEWLASVLLATKGVLIDLQTEQFETSTRSGQLVAESVPKPRSGSMKFHFEDGEKFYEHGFENMLNVVSRLMPEAAPTRYGHYEPLQGRIVDHDFSEMVSSFKSDTQIFMKARTPFGFGFVCVPCKKTFESYHPKHHMRREFLLGYLSFELRPILFSQPARLARLLTLFETLCVELNVVYAEITETEKLASWFWYGLPNNQAHTVCLGEAYQRVWPDFMSSGRKIGDRHHLVTTDRLGNRPPEPPIELMAPVRVVEELDEEEELEMLLLQDDQPEVPSYAPVFPFDFEYDLNRYIW
jgi:hypothetical protein